MLRRTSPMCSFIESPEFNPPKKKNRDLSRDNTCNGEPFSGSVCNCRFVGFKIPLQQMLTKNAKGQGAVAWNVDDDHLHRRLLSFCASSDHNGNSTIDLVSICLKEAAKQYCELRTFQNSWRNGKTATVAAAVVALAALAALKELQ